MMILCLKEATMWTYMKILFFNFLTVFFVNYLMPGVTLVSPTKLPYIQGDLIFSFSLGLSLSLIFPVLRLFNQNPTYMKIGLISFILSFGAYSILNFLPLGILVSFPAAYLWSSLIVWVEGTFTNYLEMRKYGKGKGEIKEGPG